MGARHRRRIRVGSGRRRRRSRRQRRRRRLSLVRQRVPSGRLSCVASRPHRIHRVQTEDLTSRYSKQQIFGHFSCFSLVIQRLKRVITEKQTDDIIIDYVYLTGQCRTCRHRSAIVVPRLLPAAR